MAGWMVTAIVLSVASQCWTGGERHGEAVGGIAMCAAEAVTTHETAIRRVCLSCWNYSFVSFTSHCPLDRFNEEMTSISDVLFKFSDIKNNQAPKTQSSTTQTEEQYRGSLGSS